jgi:predicted NBD/HSP70 family sugar kinase
VIEKGTPRVLARANQRLILTRLLDGGPCSRADLAKKLALSSPTIGSNVRELLRAGLVIEEGIGNTNRVGRNSILLAPRADCCAVMGVHLGLNELRWGIADFTGRVTHGEPVRHAPYRRADAIVDDVAAAADRADVLLPGFRGRLRVLALGVHGIKSERRHKNYLHLLRDMTDLGEALAHRLGIEVIIDNDVNMAVIGEMWQALEGRYRDIVYVNIERGIGAGIVLDDRLHRGRDNASGEIGHMLIDQAQCRTALGHDGALERLLLPLLADDSSGSCSAGVVDRAAMMLVNVASLVNPQIIVLGGSGGQRLAACRERILAIMARHLPTEPPELVCSRTGDRATVWGAIRVGLDRARELVFAAL